MAEHTTSSVMLINSPLFRDSVAATDEDYLPSLGLGMLACAASNAGIEVEYIDAIFEKRSVSSLINAIEFSDCGAVGINIFTVNQHLVREIVERVQRPVLFVLGGLSTRALLPVINKWNSRNPLHVVFGDGERIFPALVLNPEGVAHNQIKNGVRYYEVNTSSPYYVSDISGIYANRHIFRNEPFLNVHGKSEACVVTSRGCIYNCAFCAAARSMNSDIPVREASAKSVRRELSSILDEHPGIESIRVLDDLYLKNKESIRRATETFYRYSMSWRAMAHIASIKQVSPEDLRELRESGCSELFIGVESGSPHILRRIHKTSDTQLIREQISRLFGAGIGVKTYFIFGFPEETLDDMSLTAQLAEDMRDDALRLGGTFRTSVFQFRPYHGTELFRGSQAMGTTIKEKDARFDEELTQRIGRPQYNFESGNFSSVPITTLSDFIARTASLTAVG